MSPRARSRSGPAGVSAVAYEHSQVLPLLFEQHDRDTGLTVLDIGPAVPETVEFFAQFKCRLFVADLFAENGDADLVAAKGDTSLVATEGDTGLVAAEGDTGPAKRFQTLLDYPIQTQFDVCLFWDLLNQIDRDDLKQFSTALRPFLHRGSVAHAFAALNATTPLRVQRYGIHTMDSLVVRRDPEPPLAAHPHHQTELREALPCFEIKRGTLSKEGRLELLLNAI